MHTVFQLIDFEGNRIIGEEELAELMRTMGKRPRKAKVRKLIEDIKPKKKGEITENEFVDFMIEKRRTKGGFKPEPVPIETTRRGRSPTKKEATSASVTKKSPSRATSPKKGSTSPKKAASTSKSPSKRAPSPRKKAASPRSKKAVSPKKSNIRSAGEASSTLPTVPTTTTANSAPLSTNTHVQKPKNDLLRFYSTTAHTKNYGLGRDQAFCDFVLLVGFLFFFTNDRTKQKISKFLEIFLFFSRFIFDSFYFIDFFLIFYRFMWVLILTLFLLGFVIF